MADSTSTQTTAYVGQGERASFASTGHDAHLVVGTPEVREVVFVQGSMDVFVLDAAGLQVLDEETELFDQLIVNYHAAQAAAALVPQTQATAGEPDPAVTAAKEALAEKMEGIVNSPGGLSTFTEIRRLNGQKRTFVRSSRMRNHWRSYSLDSDDRAQSVFSYDEDGTRRLSRERLAEKAGKVEAQLKLEGKWEDEGSIVELVRGWFNEVDGSLAEPPVEEPTPAEPRGIYTDSQAQLMRYYLGASTAAEVNLRNGKIGIKGEVKASLALAEGKAGITAHLPHEVGCLWRPVVPNTSGGRSQINLGAFRCTVEATLKGFIGASIAGSLKAEMTMSEGKAVVQTLKNGENATGRTTNDSDDQIASASARAFAGVDGSIELKGSAEWDNPDKRTSGDGKWQAFMSLGVEGTGSLGIGAEGEFTVGFENKRFIIRAKAGLVFGGGLKGKVAFEVDIGVIAEFVAFMYHKLRDANFRYLAWISAEAFMALSNLVANAVAEGVGVAAVYLRDEAVDALDAIGDLAGGVYEAGARRWRSQALASNVKRADATKYATPEAKAILLDQLMISKSFGAYAEEPEEEAALVVLSWVQSRREFDEVCEHLGPGGTRVSREYGRQKLDRFFDGDDLRRYKLAQQGLAERDRLLQSMSQWVSDPLRYLYAPSAPPDSALIRNRSITP